MNPNYTLKEIEEAENKLVELTEKLEMAQKEVNFWEKELMIRRQFGPLQNVKY